MLSPIAKHDWGIPLLSNKPKSYGGALSVWTHEPRSPNEGPLPQPNEVAETSNRRMGGLGSETLTWDPQVPLGRQLEHKCKFQMLWFQEKVRISDQVWSRTAWLWESLGPTILQLDFAALLRSAALAVVWRGALRSALHASPPLCSVRHLQCFIFSISILCFIIPKCFTFGISILSWAYVHDIVFPLSHPDNCSGAACWAARHQGIGKSHTQ